MLDRTFSITRLVSPSISYHDFKLPKPKWEGALSLNPNHRHITSETPPGSDQDLSALLVGIYAMWDDVIRYIFTSNSTTPPWQPGSELATIEYRFADFEPGQILPCLPNQCQANPGQTFPRIGTEKSTFLDERSKSQNYGHTFRLGSVFN